MKLKLLEDDYQVLRKFQGRSSLKTYLTTVVQRLFLDQRIALWGKWRPSTEAKRLGPLAVRMESLTFRDGLSFDEAFETLRTNHGVTEDRAFLFDLFQRLPPRSSRRFVGEEELASLSSSGEEVEAAAVDRERAPLAQRLRTALEAAVLGLPAGDRVLLNLRFEQGLTVAEIQRSMNLDAGRLYRRFEALLATLRSALESQGFDGKTIGDLLEDGPGRDDALPAPCAGLGDAGRGRRREVRDRRGDERKDPVRRRGWQGPPARVPASRLPLRPGRGRRAGVALAALRGFLPRRTPEERALAELVRAVGPHRPVEARLTGGFEFGPVKPVMRRPSPGASEEFWDVLAAAAKIREIADQNPTARAVGELGVAHLVIGETDEAVAKLEDAVKREPNDARLLSDLSAAHLGRARLQGRTEDLARGLEAARRARRLEALNKRAPGS